MVRNSALVLVLSMAAAAGGCAAPRMMPSQSNIDAFYPRASLRLGETGVVVLHFLIGPDGRAKEPFVHDEPVIGNAGSAADGRGGLRLIEAAEKYIRAAKFDRHGLHKRQVTASFVFEVKPCGALAHAPQRDYAISLCLERLPVMWAPMS